MLINVPFEQRPQLPLPVDPSLCSWDLDLEEDMVWAMDALRPLLTALAQVIIRAIAENVNSKLSSILQYFSIKHYCTAKKFGLVQELLHCRNIYGNKFPQCGKGCRIFNEIINIEQKFFGTIKIPPIVLSRWQNR